MIDDQTLKKYQHFKGPFRNRLHNDIDWKQHVFRQYNRRCAFLNEENLCDIYTEAGPEMFFAEPAEIILDILKNLKVCVRFPCRSPVRRQQGFYFPKKKKVHFITKRKKDKKEEVYDDF